MKPFKIKSNNLSQMAQALQLHKPGDKFIFGSCVCVVKNVYISEKGVIVYEATSGGQFFPENCDWITTEVTT